VPVWGWIALGIGVLAVAFVVLVIWAYPRDNSF
jgi:hypothetical protein